MSIEQLYEEAGTGYCKYRVELSSTSGTSEVIEILLNSNWETGLRAIELGNYELHIWWEAALGMEGFEVQVRAKQDPDYQNIHMQLERVEDTKCTFILDREASAGGKGLETIRGVEKKLAEDTAIMEALRSKAETAQQLSEQIRAGASVAGLVVGARVKCQNYPDDYTTKTVCLEDEDTSDELHDILAYALEKMADRLDKKADAIESRYKAHE